MTKGGARARSGPPPDPDALRRDRKTDGEWVVLPAAGRPGPAPPWPLGLSNEAEIERWTTLWSKPHAVEWERLGQELEVALLVRRQIEAEEWGTAVNLSTLVRQMSDSLGLTTPGMRANRWRIGDPDTSPPSGTRRSSSKARLKVVAPDAVEGTDDAG